MDPIQKEKEEAAIRFCRSQSIRRLAKTVPLAVAAAWAIVAFSCSDFSSLLLWDSILPGVLRNSSKETIFVLCNLILLLVLADTGFLGRHEIPVVVIKATSVVPQQFGPDTKEDHSEVPDDEEEEVEEEGEEEKEDDDDEDDGNCWSDGESDRRFEEFISNFRRERRMEAIGLPVDYVLVN